MNGRRLYRSEQDKMLMGVSGGMADYFDIDVSLVRLGWVLVCIASAGLGLLAYLVMGLVTPTYFQLYGVEEDDVKIEEEENGGDVEDEGEGDSGADAVEGAPVAGRLGREQRRRAGRRRQRLSLRGSGGAGMFFGLVLIVIGGIALLDSVGIFGFFNFWQAWPVLIIALGAMMLWKRRDR